ncbi:MAG: hypothetical protein ACP5UO_03200 [Thermoplasmata archaeon]
MRKSMFSNGGQMKFYLIYMGIMIANVVAAAVAIIYFWGGI